MQEQYRSGDSIVRVDRIGDVLEHVFIALLAHYNHYVSIIILFTWFGKSRLSSLIGQTISKNLGITSLYNLHSKNLLKKDQLRRCYVTLRLG